MEYWLRPPDVLRAVHVRCAALPHLWKQHLVVHYHKNYGRNVDMIQRMVCFSVFGAMGASPLSTDNVQLLLHPLDILFCGEMINCCGMLGGFRHCRTQCYPGTNVCTGADLIKCIRFTVILWCFYSKWTLD